MQKGDFANDNENSFFIFANLIKATQESVFSFAVLKCVGVEH